MNRDSALLLALVVLAASALVVGVSGWLLFVRDHRAWKAVHPHEASDTSPGEPAEHPAEAS
ncbi:MAG: hypothetical protein ACM3OO_09045 [Planctomycetaceae bacterium]